MIFVRSVDGEELGEDAELVHDVLDNGATEVRIARAEL